MNFPQCRVTTIFSLAALLAMGILTVPASVSVAGEFYKGKTVKVIIRSSPGGGNDFYGRLIARHMPRHIPGKPRSIPVNMKGAGGIVAANYMHNRASATGPKSPSSAAPSPSSSAPRQTESSTTCAT